ncbi:MAG: hypothetical protein NZ576_00925 [Bacteroidia bacterium]|nr:hypothetical protein [Bacteroidia bacterium]
MFQNWKFLEKPVAAKTQMFSYWLKANVSTKIDTTTIESCAFTPFFEHDTSFTQGEKNYQIKTQTINSIDSSKAIVLINIHGREAQKCQLEWKIDKYLRWEKQITRICNARFVSLLGSQKDLYFEACFCNEDSTFCRTHYMIISQKGKVLCSGIAGDYPLRERFNRAKNLFLTNSALIHPDSGKIMEFDMVEPLLAAWLSDSVFTVVYEPEQYPNAFIFNILGDTLFSFLLEGEKEPMHFIQDKELGVHLYFMPLLNEVILFRNNAWDSPQHYNLAKLNPRKKKETFSYQLNYVDDWGFEYRFYLNKNLEIKKFEVKNKRK